MLYSASPSLQLVEVMAITFLNNSSLSEATLTNAKLELLSRAKKRDRVEKDTESVPVTVDKVAEFKDVH